MFWVFTALTCLLMRVINRFFSLVPSSPFRMHYPAFSFQNSITNAQTSSSHFLFPPRYCTAMYSYQVPLFSANPLTKHPFQFDQDNPARWMAPASWVFLGKGQRGSGVFLNKKHSHQPFQIWTERCCADPAWASGPHLTWADSEGHLTVPRSQLVCRSDVWESGVGLWETVQWACLSWWHLHTSHILGVSFSKSWGTRPWSGNCLSEPRRLYLRCSYFCFVCPIFILVTASVSDLGVSVQISLWVYVIIFSEDVCNRHFDGRNSFVTVRKMWKSRKDHAMWHQRKLIFTWKLLIHVA